MALRLTRHLMMEQNMWGVNNMPEILVGRQLMGNEYYYQVLSYIPTENGEWRFKIQSVGETILKQAITKGMVVIDNAKVEGGQLKGKTGSLDRFGNDTLTVVAKIAKDGDTIGYKVSNREGKINNVKTEELLSYCAKMTAEGNIPIQNMMYVPDGHYIKGYEWHIFPVHEWGSSANSSNSYSETNRQPTQQSTIARELTKANKNVICDMGWCAIIQDGYGYYKYVLRFNGGLKISDKFYKVKGIPGDKFIVCVTEIKHRKEKSTFDAKIINKENDELTILEAEDFGTTMIPPCYFECCTKLAHVTMPDGMKMLGGRAFGGCEMLQSVHMKTTQIKEIPKDCFQGCGKLKTVTVPPSLEKIEPWAFSDTKLTNFDLSATKITELDDIGVYAINGVKLPSCIRRLGYNSLQHLKGHHHLDLSHTDICDIDDSALTGASVIEITLPKNQVRTLGKGALSQCSELVNINTEDTIIESFALSAFNYTGTECIRIPRTTYKVYDVLREQTKLRVLDMSRTRIIQLGNNKEEQYKDGNISGILACTALTSILFPTSFEHLLQDAIRKCDWLRVLDFSETSLKTIDERAISDCKRLTRIYVPEDFSGKIPSALEQFIVFGGPENDTDENKRADAIERKLNLMYELHERLGDSNLYKVKLLENNYVIAMHQGKMIKSVECKQIKTLSDTVVGIVPKDQNNQWVLAKITENGFIYSEECGRELTWLGGVTYKIKQKCDTSYEGSEIVAYDTPSGFVYGRPLEGFVEEYKTEKDYELSVSVDMRALYMRAVIKIEYIRGKNKKVNHMIYRTIQLNGENVIVSPEYTQLSLNSITDDGKETDMITVAVTEMKFYPKANSVNPILIKKCVLLDRFGQEIKQTTGYKITRVIKMPFIKVFRYESPQHAVQKLGSNVFTLIDITKGFSVVQDTNTINKMSSGEYEETSVINVLV